MKREPSPFRDHTAESALFLRRTLVVLVVIVILTSVLIANLYHLQINRHEEYSTRSNQNRIKLVPIPPTRGIIYDRHGVPLAENRPVYRLEIIPERVENLDRVLQELTPIVDLTEENIADFHKERKQLRRFVSVPLKNELTDLQIARFSVNQYRFPGVEVNRYLHRYYPYGASLTHVIGYVSKINDKDMERLDQEEKLANYADTHDIGKLGIERYYEDVLHGVTGYAEVEVNNRGRVVRHLQEHPPQAGRDIYLALDLKLQQYIEQLLIGSRAAVVVSDPRTGGILAMVSSPGYDPNPFVGGISRKAYSRLLDDPDRPLINRVTQGVYPPGSTIKPYMLVAALSSNVITPNTTIYSKGSWQLPGTEKSYRDWKRGGHGNVDLVKAIEESVDTLFYQIAYDMGIDRLSNWMTKFGYGHYSGIDLAEERTGLMPTREWKQKRYKKPWYQGDTIPVGIGQGYWLATPVQMSKALMTLINNGQVKVPHLLLSTRDNGQLVPYQPQEEEPLKGVAANYWAIAKQGMLGMANNPRGTGRKYFADSSYTIAAKSGTAQVFNLKEKEVYDASKLAVHLRDHKLMSAYAPYEDPKVAVTIILENGGLGGSVGEITRQILDYIMLGADRPGAVTAADATSDDEDNQ